ncbi:MAG: D-glycerate dehydrogenase [Balneolaceae bacterium]|nr:D-glycerate dehydrogenase [Balneolaceae bacterium]
MSDSKHNILVTEPIPEEVLSYLKGFGNVTVGEAGEYQHVDQLIADIPKFDALLCMLSNPVNEQVLKAGSKLKVVANFAVGYNNIDVEAAQKLSIKVANTPDVLTEACGDFAMGLLLATTRHFYAAEKYLRDGKFNGWEPMGFLGPELRGRTLGIVGMGRIGQAFARRAKAFGMEIIYHNRSSIEPELEKELEASYFDDLEAMVQKADVLSLNCPLTPQTHHLVDERLLNLMPKHAVLINISRGPVVDEAALAKALHNRTIYAAGLDVFEEEPKVHPELLSAPNCTMLPHIASATFETREAIGMLAAKAIVQVLQGESEQNIPNLVSVS